MAMSSRSPLSSRPTGARSPSSPQEDEGQVCFDLSASPENVELHLLGNLNPGGRERCEFIQSGAYIGRID